MASIHLPQPYSSDPASKINTHSTLRPPVRPKFHHQNTNDRIREGSGRPPTFSMISKIKKDRKSIFKELGLDTDEPSPRYTSEHEFGYITGLSSRRVFQSDSDGDGDDGRSENEKPRADERERQSESESQRPSTPRTSANKPWYTKLSPGRRPRIKTVGSAPPFTMSTRLSTTALLIAVVLPAFSYYNGREQVSLSGADAGVMTSTGSPIPVLETRADSPTDVCARWAHQAAHVNGTLYVYGGQAKRTKDQTTDTWNNYFLTLDLTKSWDVSSPALKGLPQPDGPPQVSMGYLWHDYNSLFLYGGEFADNPFVEPFSSSTWRYAIKDKQWTEFQNPKTSRGNNSDGGDTQVQRSAEGAGVSVPELGLSWYFGGHLDLSTTQGWSNQIPRVYLKSLLEFTHPGYTNNAIYSLADGTGAGESGAYRNITEGGLQADSAFYERADGVLVFVPGWGEKGVLIGLAGGTNETFTDDLSVLDVYDIARSEWYHQETRGAPPSVRVNPCAVIASAPDASSFQIYVYGGQNLIPYGEQVQYSDMYILSIPSFTWIKAPQSQGPNNPAPRAGHTCSLRDGQMVVVGGYIGQNKPCDSPGIYVFDASTLQWKSSFTALGSKADLNPENSVLAGSYGYRVPQAVAKVIGGDENGGATVTTPAAGPATGGPFATGKSPAFTVTDAGSTATITRWGPGATDTNGPVAPGTGGASGGSGGETPRQSGLIAAGVIAGMAGLLALYLGYCAWLYRRQVRAYKSHLAITNRYAGASTTGGWGAFFGGRKSSKESKKSARAAAHGQTRRHLRDPSMSTVSDGGDYENYNNGNNRNSWDGQRAMEPKFMLDDEPTPESGYYSGTGASGSGMARPAPVVSGWWADTSAGGSHGSGGTGTSQGASSGGRERMSSVVGGGVGETRGRMSEESNGSMDALIQGQEPSFFSVVLGPRRALRVVNGLEGEVHGLEGDIDQDGEGDHDWEGYTGGGGYRVPPDDDRGEGNTMKMSRS